MTRVFFAALLLLAAGTPAPAAEPASPPASPPASATPAASPTADPQAEQAWLAIRTEIERLPAANDEQRKEVLARLAPRFAAFARRFPNHREAEQALSQALRIYALLEQPAEGIAVGGELLARNPQGERGLEAVQYLVRLHLLGKQPDLARGVINARLQAEGDPVLRSRLELLLARVAEEQERNDEAEPIYRRLATEALEQPGGNDYLLTLAAFLARTARPGEAAEVLAGNLERFPIGAARGQRENVALQVAMLRAQAGDAAAAVRQLGDLSARCAGLSRRAPNPPARQQMESLAGQALGEMLALCARQADLFPIGEEILNRLAASDPPNASYYNLARARLLRDARRDDEAAELLAAVAGQAGSPLNEVCLDDLLTLALIRQRPELARGRLEQLAANAPDDDRRWLCRLFLGRLLAGSGQIREAEEILVALRESATSQRQRSAIAGQLAEFYLETDRPADADRILSEAEAGESDRPARAFWRLQRALAWEQADDCARARQVAESLLADFPDHPAAERLRQELLPQLAAGERLANGRAVPDFRAPLAGPGVEGEATPAMFAGRPTVYFFWSTTNRRSQELAGQIEQARRDLGFQVLWIALDADAEAVNRAVVEQGLGGPLVCDGEGNSGPLAQAFAVLAAPRLFLCDAQGVIRGKNLPLPRLRQAVAALLPAATPAPPATPPAPPAPPATGAAQ